MTRCLSPDPVQRTGGTSTVSVLARRSFPFDTPGGVLAIDYEHERVALNEAMFREANERVSAWPERENAAPTDELACFCECADRECRQHIKLTVPEYEALRAESMHFAIVPGHERPDADRVIQRSERYAVVEKYEDVREIAEATDPRTGPST